MRVEAYTDCGFWSYAGALQVYRPLPMFGEVVFIVYRTDEIRMNHG